MGALPIINGSNLINNTYGNNLTWSDLIIIIIVFIGGCYIVYYNDHSKR